MSIRDSLLSDGAQSLRDWRRTGQQHATLENLPGRSRSHLIQRNNAKIIANQFFPKQPSEEHYFYKRLWSKNSGILFSSSYKVTVPTGTLKVLRGHAIRKPVSLCLTPLFPDVIWPQDLVYVRHYYLSSTTSISSPHVSPPLPTGPAPTPAIILSTFNVIPTGLFPNNALSLHLSTASLPHARL